MSGMLVMTGLTVSLPKSIVFPRDFVSAISLDTFVLDLQIWTDFAPSQNFPKNCRQHLPCDELWLGTQVLHNLESHLGRWRTSCPSMPRVDDMTWP